MSSALEAVAQNQGLWSETANVMKARYERARGVVFTLSIGAALLATVSSQLDGRPRQVLAILSTVCMGIVSLLTARMLNASHSQGWVRARAAAEALKQHAYRRAARAAPYEDPATADALLSAEAEKIIGDVDDLINERVSAATSSAPVNLISATDYIEKRVRNQAEWHERKAGVAQQAGQMWRRIEFGLALLTAIITAVVGALEKGQLGWFDFVALTAVLTTLSGTILAYIEASRYDFIVSTYRATARRLRLEETKAPAATEPAAVWSAFVDRCESILQEQNNTWVAKFSRPAANS
jgi:hypothetical protein